LPKGKVLKMVDVVQTAKVSDFCCLLTCYFKLFGVLAFVNAKNLVKSEL